MIHITKYFLCLIIMIFCRSLIAQENQIDSLLSVIKKNKKDTLQLINLNMLSRQYNSIGIYDSAIFYAKSSLLLNNDIRRESKNNYIIETTKKCEAASYNNLGNVYSNEGNYSNALENYFLSLKIRKAIDDFLGQAASYNNIGNIYYAQGDYSKALKNYFASLKITEKLGEKLSIATAYNNIGSVYSDQGNYSEAIKNYFISLKINSEIGNKLGMIEPYNNIGNIYSFQNNFTDALKNHFASLKIAKAMGDKQSVANSYNNIGNVYDAQGKFSIALKNYFSSLSIRKEINDRKGIGDSYNNIGSVYKSQGKYADALQNYFASLDEKLTIGDKAGIANSNLSIGIVYFAQKKYNEAIPFLLVAKKIALEIGYKDIAKNAFNTLANLYDLQNKPKLSLENFKQYILYKDSLDNEESRKKLVQNQMTFDFEKKEAVANILHKKELENQNFLADEKSRKQNLVIIFVGIGLLFVVIFAAFVFRSLRLTRKQKLIIEAQKEIVEQQKEIVEEKHKEITDSINYAERIQRSFLATKELLNDNLKEHFVFFQPKDVVSGDFYWASKLSNGNFCLATADSTGHGVPGAIMSILNISCLEKALEIEFICEPAEILNYARLKIIERLKKDGSIEGGKDGMDCSLISFNLNENKLTYAAANNPVWIVRDNQLLEFAPDKMPVGKHIRDDVPFTQHSVKIQKNDVIYAFTDGLQDQFGGPKGKKYMHKQLKALLINISTLPMLMQKEEISASLNSWKGQLYQVDDICIIGVRI